MKTIDCDIPLFLNKQGLKRKTKNNYGCWMRRVINEHITEENINEKYPFPECSKSVQHQLLFGIELLREMEIWEHGGGITKRHEGGPKKTKGRSNIGDR